MAYGGSSPLSRSAAGWSMRTGKGNDCLLSARIPRDGWQEIDFQRLADVDLPAALGRFELRRKMTKSGVFTLVEPITPPMNRPRVELLRYELQAGGRSAARTEAPTPGICRIAHNHIAGRVWEKLDQVSHTARSSRPLNTGILIQGKGKTATESSAPPRGGR